MGQPGKVCSTIRDRQTETERNIERWGKREWEWEWRERKLDRMREGCRGGLGRSKAGTHLAGLLQSPPADIILGVVFRGFLANSL